MNFEFDRTIISPGITIKEEKPEASKASTTEVSNAPTTETLNTSTIGVEACNYSTSVPKFVQNCHGQPNGLAWILAFFFFVFTPVGRWILNANILGVLIATRRR